MELILSIFEPDAMSRTRPVPNSLKEVTALLTELQLPVQPERLQAISRQIGQRFKNELAGAASGNSRSDLYVRTVFKAISPDVVVKVGNITGETVSLDHLVVIANEEGSGFLASLDMAVNGQTEAITYVKRTLAMVKKGVLLSAMDYHPTLNISEAVPTESRLGQPSIVDEKKNGQQVLTTKIHQEYKPEPSKREPLTVVESETQDREYKSTHVYGLKSACCFNVDVSRSNKAHVIRIEGAPGENRNFNWKSKISIQLTVGELVLMTACLLGDTDKLEIAGHGDNNDKFATIERQEGHYFITLSQRGCPKIGVQITAVDLFPVTTLFLDQIRRNVPEIPHAIIRELIKNSADLHNAKSRKKLAA